MTAYRFRVTFDPAPSSLWRDVVVGSDRTLDEFQTTINATMGLDQGHLWSVGTDGDYWNSDVRYQCPQEFEGSQDGIRRGDVRCRRNDDQRRGRRGGLDERDRICRLYDYGDEWRFYAILEEIVDDEPDERGPEVVEARPSSSTPPISDGGFDRTR